jgi:histidine triad (HIT) family protein
MAAGKEYSEEELSKMSAEEIAELQKQNCIFCKIASKEIPAKIIHEDSDVICILDINPASEGHILVYPKKHYMIMPHMPDDVLAKVFKNVKLMSQTLLKSLQCKGTTVFVANGVAAGQKAPHVLIHVFPRRENDGLVKLPTYEMSDGQVLKLKGELKPYLNQLFGVKRSAPVVKEAEFTDKKKDSIKEKKEEPKESEDEESEEPKREHVKEHAAKRHETEHPKEKKPEEKPKATEQTKPTKAKVDLDDIARLFGG